jgi:Na+/proline symporter
VSMMIGSVLIVIFYGFSIQTATYVKAGFPDLEDPQQALATAINNWVPVGIRGLTLAVIFAIGQTTIGTIWNNIVSIATKDVYGRMIVPNASEKKLLRFSRIFTVAIAIFTIIVSITIVDQVINTLFVANIFMSSLFFPALGGFLWWRTGLKAIWTTTILAIIIGFATFFTNYHGGNYDINEWMFQYYVIITPIIIALGIVISYFEKPSKEFMMKKIAFFDKVGAPWFGKKAYLEYKKSNGIDIKDKITGNQIKV